MFWFYISTIRWLQSYFCCIHQHYRHITVEIHNNQGINSNIEFSQESSVQFRHTATHAVEQYLPSGFVLWFASALRRRYNVIIISVIIFALPRSSLNTALHHILIEWKENLFKCSIYIEYKTKYSQKPLERIAFPLTENQIFLCIFFDRFTSSVSVELLRTIALYSKQDIVCAQLYRYIYILRVGEGGILYSKKHSVHRTRSPHRRRNSIAASSYIELLVVLTNLKLFFHVPNKERPGITLYRCYILDYANLTLNYPFL